MAGNDRKEFLTDLPENYDIFQENQANRNQTGFENGQPNGYQDGFGNGQPNGYQDGFGNGQPNGYQDGSGNGQPNGYQNGYGNPDDFTNSNPFYFDNTGFSQEQWQSLSYPVNTKPLRQGMAITSMILGILSIVLCCIFGGVLALPGLILGIISLVSKRDGTGMAVAGVITSIFGLLLGVLMVLLLIGTLKDISDAAKEGKTSYNYSYSFGTDDFNFDQNYDYNKSNKAREF